METLLATSIRPHPPPVSVISLFPVLLLRPLISCFASNTIACIVQILAKNSSAPRLLCLSKGLYLQQTRLNWS